MGQSKVVSGLRLHGQESAALLLSSNDLVQILCRCAGKDAKAGPCQNNRWQRISPTRHGQQQGTDMQTA